MINELIDQILCDENLNKLAEITIQKRENANKIIFQVKDYPLNAESHSFNMKIYHILDQQYGIQAICTGGAEGEVDTTDLRKDVNRAYYCLNYFISNMGDQIFKLDDAGCAIILSGFLPHIMENDRDTVHKILANVPGRMKKGDNVILSIFEYLFEHGKHPAEMYPIDESRYAFMGS